MSIASARDTLRPRVLAAIALGLTIIVGLWVRSDSAPVPRWLGQHLGVGLWAMASYWLVRVVAPRSTILASAGAALLVSWAVEFLQLTPISRTLSEIHPFLRLLFGEVFDPADLVWLAVGVGVSAGLHWATFRGCRAARAFIDS